VRDDVPVEDEQGRMTVGDAACGTPTANGEPHFWERAASIWHAVFVLGMIGAAFATYSNHGVSRPRGLALLAIIAALAVWYAATGARALRHDRPGLGHLYLAGLVPAFALLFVTIPQIYIFVERLLIASGIIVVLYSVFAAVLIATSAELRDRPWMLILPLGISLAFSLLFGGWIHGIIRQSTKRAELIGELERTRAELAAERHDAGVLAERTRLATEIHDTLAQGFTSILMLTQAAEASLRRDPDAAQDALTLIERTTRENLAEARSLVAALAPAALDGTTLPEALHRLADRHRAETRAEVSVDVSGDPAPAPDTDVVLLRAAQETLANVRKHACAARVRVLLGYRPDGVTLVVTDDGAGFDPTANGSGYGLRGMRHRVEQSGGIMTVTSAPGAGTTVEVAMP
jgi:signal transduction histidine kinase